jgi:hypothetical protein
MPRCAPLFFFLCLFLFAVANLPPKKQEAEMKTITLEAPKPPDSSMFTFHKDGGIQWCYYGQQSENLGCIVFSQDDTKRSTYDAFMRHVFTVATVSNYGKQQQPPPPSPEQQPTPAS